MAGSACAPSQQPSRVPVPAAVGRHGRARPRQQRPVRRLPAGRAGRPAVPARGTRRRPGGNRPAGGAARGALPGAAALPCRAGPDRAVGERDPGGVLHRRLRDRRRRAGAEGVRRGPHPAGPVQHGREPPAPDRAGRTGRAGGADGDMSVFRHPMLVRWSDIDSYDHVNNVRYFDYLQEARIAFLSEAFGTDDFFGTHPIVLVSQTVDYLRPILLRHPPYDVDVWVEAVGGTSYTLGSKIVDRGGETELVYAKATSVLVAVAPVTHAKRPLTEAERAALVGRVPSDLRH